MQAHLLKNALALATGTLGPTLALASQRSRADGNFGAGNSPPLVALLRHRSQTMTKVRTLERQPAARLDTPTDLPDGAVREISAALNGLLADAFALYLKTKNFHWHISGPHFRDYHLLLDEQSDQIFAMTDPIAERVRKLGGLTICSIGQIARTQRIADNDAEYVDPNDMLA